MAAVARFRDIVGHISRTALSIAATVLFMRLAMPFIADALAALDPDARAAKRAADESRETLERLRTRIAKTAKRQWIRKQMAAKAANTPTTPMDKIDVHSLINTMPTMNVRLNKWEHQLLADVVFSEDIDITFDSIGGLERIKQDLLESVILPLQEPELFHTPGTEHSRLLQAPRGVLLYGPPGTGKTMMAKAIAKTCRATFINVKASNIQDKYFGESSKIVQAVFTLAHKLAPSIIFLDECDTFLRARSHDDHEAGRSIKATFMCEWDGLQTSSFSQVLLLGCTNRPFDIDTAVLRRMPRQLLFGLPTVTERLFIIRTILRGFKLADDVDLQHVAEQTKGYSGSDLNELCKFAAHIPITEALRSRRITFEAQHSSENDIDDQVVDFESLVDPSSRLPVRAITSADFEAALDAVPCTGAASYEQQVKFESYARKHMSAAEFHSFKATSEEVATDGLRFSESSTSSEASEGAAFSMLNSSFLSAPGNGVVDQTYLEHMSQLLAKNSAFRAEFLSLAKKYASPIDEEF